LCFLAPKTDERKASVGLNVGDEAPAFSLPGHDGGRIDLAALSGRKVVLFFYPKADTTACTQEAIDFTALAADFAAAGAAVVGISRDPVKALDRFATKRSLGVMLGSDEDGRVVEAYGVWVEKSMYGKSYMGIERTTVLIDAAGRVVRIWPKVKVKGHAAEVLEAARAL
jgi:peroxiredoxin Q/BCP